jgi:hypothetical protein
VSFALDETNVLESLEPHVLRRTSNYAIIAPSFPPDEPMTSMRAGRSWAQGGHRTTSLAIGRGCVASCPLARLDGARSPRSRRRGAGVSKKRSVGVVIELSDGSWSTPSDHCVRGDAWLRARTRRRGVRHGRTTALRSLGTSDAITAGICPRGARRCELSHWRARFFNDPGADRASSQHGPPRHVSAASGRAALFRWR